jgi:uncharacterized protein YodC (DUF2158 family)
MEMKTVFEVGDIVHLKSGSPGMTVESVGVGPCGSDTVSVHWFDGVNECKCDDFSQASLEPSPRYTEIVDLYKFQEPKNLKEFV